MIIRSRELSELREHSRRGGGFTDSLTLPTRFALTRVVPLAPGLGDSGTDLFPGTNQRPLSTTIGRSALGLGGAVMGRRLNRSPARLMFGHDMDDMGAAG